MIYVVAFILLIVAVVICHIRDWKENKKTGKVNHNRAAWWKVLLSAPAGFCFTIYLTGWPILLNWSTFLASGKSILITGAWFLFLFNGIWGMRAIGKLFYVSNVVGKNAPKLDSIFQKWGDGAYKLFIVALLTGATVLYFIKWPTF